MAGTALTTTGQDITGDFRVHARKTADPTNDYPNGNPAYFYDDHQHPNAAGHAIMATGYWNATNSVKPY